MTEQEQIVMARWMIAPEPIACDEGLALLLPFAMRSNSLYHLAERVDFIDPDFFAFKPNHLWLAFAEHRSTCPKCNEV